MRILGIDCGTKTGWAYCDDSFTISGVIDFTLKRGESSGMKFLRFHGWLREMLVKHRPALVVYELPHHRGGYATQSLNTMCGLVMMGCAKREIEYVGVHSATLKKHATGSGRASKEDMLKAARTQFGEDVKTDDEADALFLMNWGLIEIARRELDEGELEF